MGGPRGPFPTSRGWIEAHLTIQMNDAMKESSENSEEQDLQKIPIRETSFVSLKVLPSV